MASYGGRSIHVSLVIHGPIDRLWQLTQTTAEHRRWDVRFTDIDYLPRPDPAGPQQFTYATRIGFGLAVRGRGETAGSHDAADGSRTSALRFWSDDPKSLIREGSGYWAYRPHGDAVTFATVYDYDVRFGAAGRGFDRLVFRPLMGRATAWSFDRLRLWIEDDVDPRSAARAAVIYAAARLGVAFVWLYHGLVPKLIFRHADEVSQLTDVGWSTAAARQGVVAAGAVEIVLRLVVLIFWRSRWPMWFTIFAMLAATVYIAVVSPRFLNQAFNAVTLNASMTLLAAIALLAYGLTPFSSRCARVPEAKTR